MDKPTESQLKEPELDPVREDLKGRIKEALEARDWNLMEHWARQWLRFDPKGPDAFKWLARSAMALGKMPRAAYAYGRVLDLEPHNEEATRFFQEFPSSNEAENFETKTQNDAESARDAVTGKKGLSLKQRQALSTAEFELAKAYQSCEFFDKAAQHFIESYQHSATKNAALEASRALHKAHKSIEAIRFLKDRLRDYPDWTEARILVGRILQDCGRESEAQEEYQIVLNKDPSHTEALNLLRSLLLRKSLS